MNSRVRYITAAVFLFVFELLIISKLWFLSILFGAVTIVYITLEFYGMRPRYFLRSALFVILISYLVDEAVQMVEIFTTVESLVSSSENTIQEYVISGLQMLQRLF